MSKLVSKGGNEQLVIIGGLARTGGSLVPFLLDGNPGFAGIAAELPISSTGRVLDEQFFASSDAETIMRAVVKAAIRRHDSPMHYDKSYQPHEFDHAAYVRDILDLSESGKLDAHNYLALTAVLWLKYRGVATEDTTIPVNHSGRAFWFSTAALFEAHRLGYYVYTRRNNLNWYSSFVRYNQELVDDLWYAETALQTKRLCDLLAADYEARYPGRFLIVDYEDLVRDPAAAIRKVYQLVGRAAPDSLSSQPTFLGRPAKSNSNFAQRKTSGSLVVGNSFEIAGYSSGMAECLRALNDRAMTVTPENIGQMAQQIHNQYAMLTRYRDIMAMRTSRQTTPQLAGVIAARASAWLRRRFGIGRPGMSAMPPAT